MNVFNLPVKRKVPCVLQKTVLLSMALKKLFRCGDIGFQNFNLFNQLNSVAVAGMVHYLPLDNN